MTYKINCSIIKKVIKIQHNKGGGRCVKRYNSKSETFQKVFFYWKKKEKIDTFPLNGFP